MSDSSLKLVIAEDALIEKFSKLLDIINREEYGSDFQSVTFIALKDLSDHFGPDRSSFIYSSCIYVTEGWGNEENDQIAEVFLEWVAERFDAVTAIVYCGTEVGCQNPPESRHSKIRIRYSDLGQGNQEKKRIDVVDFEKQMKLLAVLLTMSKSDESSFFDYQLSLQNVTGYGVDVDVQLNYDALFSAVKRSIFLIRDEAAGYEETIEETNSILARLQKESLSIVSEQDFGALPSFDAPREYPLGSISKDRIAIMEGFSFVDAQLAEATKADVSTLRTSMNEIKESPDEESAGQNTLLIREARVPGEVPTERSLLRKAGDLSSQREYLRVASEGVKELEEPEKPDYRAIISISVSVLLVFLLSVGLVFLQQSITAGFKNTDKKLLLMFVCVPSGLILLSVLAAVIFSAINRVRLKKLTRKLRAAVYDFAKEARSFIENMRGYLNDFITVFYNGHSRNRVKALQSKLNSLNNKLKQITERAEENNVLAENIESSARYAQWPDVRETGKAINTAEKCESFIAENCTEPDCGGSMAGGLWSAKNPWIHTIYAVRL